jgi:hypothetical protein
MVGTLALCPPYKFLIQFSNSTDRHCEPTGRSNARPMTGSAKQSIAPAVIASEAKQSIVATERKNGLLRFARNDEESRCTFALATRCARGDDESSAQ